MLPTEVINPFWKIKEQTFQCAMMNLKNIEKNLNSPLTLLDLTESQRFYI